MSSGKSEGIHSGPYGAAVMTSLSWFSGKSEPSRKFMVCPCGGFGYGGGRRGSKRQVTDDAGALHLSVARRVVHDRVVLGRTVVPHRHAVRLPAEAHLVFRDVRLGDQVLQQLRTALRVVLAD